MAGGSVAGGSVAGGAVGFAEGSVGLDVDGRVADCVGCVAAGSWAVGPQALSNRAAASMISETDRHFMVVTSFRFWFYSTVLEAYFQESVHSQ